MKQRNPSLSSVSTPTEQEQAVIPKMSDPKKTATTAATAAANGSVVVSAGAAAIGTKPTLIEKPPMRFLIMDAPRHGNLHLYIREMRKHHVVHVVRVCEPTYGGGELQNAGICLHEMEYKDGTSPKEELIHRWLELVDKTFYSGAASDPPPCIAVHCVAGLGRAPVMVAIALIEFAGMDPVEAVSFLREKRRGAINEKQLLYLSGEYKKMYKKKAAAGGDGGCCVIL
uniref:protein-tyrosine-phosphatase n=1 Tax=Amphora coffeiformis TaxID=265554 RepID=A0A6S8K9F4_9STRA|mmetsp:Transcript_17771/g.33734  ORF Transcript_17771/g.33734 Transcript_17771/m.33734 type:complete len:227 (+) Transcript_17771:151-831(+)|eukprot:scaffold351_cov148-Amphora_coffeaeformis.AAC.16